MIERRGLRPLLVMVGLVVTVACMYVAVRGVALDDALDALADSDLRWLAPTVPVFVLAIALRALRWWSLFAAAQRPPLRAITYALLLGYFFNNILPARAGEAARVIALHRRASTPKAKAIGTVVVERLFDVLALLIVLFASYPWLPEISWLRAAAIFGAVVVTVLLTLVVVVVRYTSAPCTGCCRRCGGSGARASPSACRPRRSTRRAVSWRCAARGSRCAGCS